MGAPLGFFDPVGLSKKGDIAVYRAAEVKHGRVCMLATLGMVVSEKFHPFFDAWGEGEFVSAAAIHFTKTAGTEFWVKFWLLTGIIEVATYKSPEEWANSELPGDLGF